jgi:hypothetical protein
VIDNARNEVLNEEGCGAINPCCSGIACCCGHSRGAAAAEGPSEESGTEQGSASTSLSFSLAGEIFSMKLRSN